jgi:hypothetical protein
MNINHVRVSFLLFRTWVAINFTLRAAVAYLYFLNSPFRKFGPDNTRNQIRHHCANPLLNIILPSTSRSPKLSFLEVFLLIFCIHFPSIPHACCMYLELKRGVKIWITFAIGRPVAQAVSRWLPTASARVRVRAACGVCCGQSGTGAVFLRVLWFPLPIIPPISPSS